MSVAAGVGVGRVGALLNGGAVTVTELPHRVTPIGDGDDIVVIVGEHAGVAVVSGGDGGMA